MKFEIDFNTETDPEYILSLGAKLERGFKFDPNYSIFTIELENFEDLEKLLERVDKEKGDLYSAIVSFDPPTIFLDSDV